MGMEQDLEDEYFERQKQGKNKMDENTKNELFNLTRELAEVRLGYNRNTEHLGQMLILMQSQGTTIRDLQAQISFLTKTMGDMLAELSANLRSI